jgi:ubiquinone biosynthesis protein Coq4
MPEEAMINLLKTLPEDALVEVFWKTLVESDVSPLTDEEKKEIEKGKVEFQKGETIRWENLR